MAWEPVEEWLKKGFTLPKFLVRAVGVGGLVISAIAIVKALRHLVYGADSHWSLFCCDLGRFGDNPSQDHS